MMKWLLFFLLFTLALGGCNAPDALPFFGKVPSFSFTDASDEAVTLSHFKEKVWLVNFFFTSCPEVCPKLMQKMQEVQKRTQNIQVLSISIDPETDTSSRLGEYLGRYDGDPAQWHLVRGDMVEVRRFAREGLKLGFGSEVNDHTTRVTLIDQEGNIRGYYQSTDEDFLDRIVRDIDKIRG